MKVEIFSIKILILAKILLIFLFHTYTTRRSDCSSIISFEKYIQNFLPSFSTDDVEIFDLYAHKNAKHLFYRFKDYIKMPGGKRQTIKHTLKVKDLIGLKKIEERDQQFLVEKIIHAAEFKNLYENSIKKKFEIIDTVESNYRIKRRVYQHLHADIADLFFKYIHSLDPDEI